MTVRRLVLLLTLVLAVGCRPKPVEDPLAKYQNATEAQATKIGQEIEKGFAEGHPEVLDSHIDYELMATRIAQAMGLNEQKQKYFIEGFKKSIGEKGAMGRQLQTSFGEGASLKLLRVHTVAQKQRAMLRMLAASGMVNYLDLVVQVDPAGTPRIVDMDNYAAGELLSETLRALMAPLVATTKKSFIERLVSGTDPKQEAQLEAISRDMPKIRAAMNAGKHAEAMEMLKALPPDLQKTRAGMLIRVSCSQGLGDEEYARALDAIDAAFPDDPSLALIQIDRHYMKKDWPKALEALRRVSRGVGGDAYLDTMQANIMVEMSDLDGARRMTQRAIKTEPTLETAWWAAVTVTLHQQDHAETARLLTEMEQQFKVTFSDLQGQEIYEHFVRSPEYRAWMKRPRHFEAAAGDEE